MIFDLKRAIEILRQTPFTLSRMLDELSPEWTQSRGDNNNWSPYDVIGHLIHGEETDWMPRCEIILAQGENTTFVPFDRLAQFEGSNVRSLDDLLIEFTHLRNTNIERLVRLEIRPDQLRLKGLHPELGKVTLEQLLATWVVHDLNHIRQIVTYMAREYEENVGAWKEYLQILN